MFAFIFALFSVVDVDLHRGLVANSRMITAVLSSKSDQEVVVDVKPERGHIPLVLSAPQHPLAFSLGSRLR